MVKISIVNVVATATLNQEVNLEELGKLDEVRYDPNVYGGRVAYFKSPKIKGTVSIFASGKMISVGTKSEKEAINALKYVKEFLVKKRFSGHSMLKPRIRNIVATVNFEKKIDLEELAKRYRMIYEPEQFPGGIIKINEPYKATILLFASGKAVVTGFKTCNQIDSIIREIISKISSIIRNEKDQSVVNGVNNIKRF